MTDEPVTGPNMISIADDSKAGPCPSISPTEYGCTGSENSKRIVVSGSTFTSPLPGVMRGWLVGGGAVSSSGVAKS